MIANLKPYSAYKPSGVEWLREVPEALGDKSTGPKSCIRAVTAEVPSPRPNW